MALHDIDIDLLRAFVAVAQCGNFTQAADRVNRSQSAVSQKILRLESLLGHRVFHRTSRHLSLTEEGQHLLPLTHTLLAQYDDFLRALQSPPSLECLRLGIADNLVPTRLPALLARANEQQPKVMIDISAGSSQTLTQQFLRGELDMVIAKQSGAGGRYLWREPLQWVAARGYRLPVDGPLPLITLPPPCTYREAMLAALHLTQRPWAEACIVNTLASLQAAVAGGLGVSALGQELVTDAMQVLGPADGLPTLGESDIVVLGEQPATAHLTEPLLEALRQSWQHT